jgi:hypothetical protein
MCHIRRTAKGRRPGGAAGPKNYNKKMAQKAENPDGKKN